MTGFHSKTKCGCTIYADGSFDYCPLHLAAEDLLEIAKEALCWLDPDCKLDGETENDDNSDRENMIIGLYEAITKAEGGLK